MLDGIIIRAVSGFYTVQTQQGVFICQLRGRLKSGKQNSDVVAIGDRVQINPIHPPRKLESMHFQDANKGSIETIYPRIRTLSRISPSPRGEYRQIIVSNLDQICLIFSCDNPKPHLGMVDRFLVIAEQQNIPALIVANKHDLVSPQKSAELFGHYPGIGYPVIYTSTLTREGIDILVEHLRHKISVLVGPSGVGKTSLLNIIQPGLNLNIQDISQTSQKGKHTTVIRQVYPLDTGGFIADTPGLKALALWNIEPEELDGYFPEMCNLVHQCEYNDCTHIDETNCAIRKAVDQGYIHAARYRSYTRLRLGTDNAE